MYRNKGLTASLTALFLAVFFTAAQAAIEKVKLKGEEFKKATGEATIKDVAGGQKEITVEVKGLTPDSVYTLWVVREKPKMDMAGVGKGDFSFKSDSEGKARYTATITEEQLREWEKLEVAYHPDGNPRNMENIKIAVEGDLEKAKAKSPEERPAERRGGY